MTKEQKELYDKIVATGRYNEEQLARLRAGFEKPPRQIDIKKSELHFEMVGVCQMIEQYCDQVQVDWKPEDEDGNAYIYIVAEDFAVIAGKAKSNLEKAMKAADTVTLSRIDGDDGFEGVVLTLGFMDIIIDSSKPNNMSAN